MVHSSRLAKQDVVATRRITRSMVVEPTVLSAPAKSSTTKSARNAIKSVSGSRRSGNRRTRKIVTEAMRSEQTVLAKSLREIPPLSAPTFGLIQERIAHNLYLLVLQAILWNQTTGRQARPVLERMVARYPSPTILADASLQELTTMLQPIGLHNIRAARCIALGQKWCENPPSLGKRYVRKGYEVQDGDDGAGLGWEIAHLPGVGPYALDSYRIFHRDEFRGLATDWLGSSAADENFEPEWKRVVPTDKELRAYLKWMWLKEGWTWNEQNGNVKRVKRRRGDEPAPSEPVLSM